MVVTGLPDFQYRLRQAAREYREYREHNDLIKPHIDELDTDTGCKPQNQTRSKPEEKWDPSKELSIQLKKTSPSDTSGNEPSSIQEHSTSSSASRMHWNQLHAWQFFNWVVSLVPEFSIKWKWVILLHHSHRSLFCKFVNSYRLII